MYSLSKGQSKDTTGTDEEYASTGRRRNQSAVDRCIDRCSRTVHKSRGGEKYCLSYHCTFLKVPMLEAMTDLKADTFSRALARAILRTRVIPDIIRSDRRQEMTNHAIEELMALCSIKHRVGAAKTPRHQGPCERAHQAIMNSHYLIMHSLLDNYAQEWALAIPFLEYAAMTAPREPYGLSAWDPSCPYAY